MACHMAGKGLAWSTSDEEKGIGMGLDLITSIYIRINLPLVHQPILFWGGLTRLSQVASTSPTLSLSDSKRILLVHT